MEFWLSFNELLIISIFLLLGAVVYYKHIFSYWERRNVVTLPKTFLFGNLDNPLTSSRALGDQFKQSYDAFEKQNLKYGGLYLFAQPTLSPLDMDLIKNILTKDYHYFDSRGAYTCEQEVVSNHLFNLEEDKWRSLRTKLTPTFTSGKMKMMYDTLLTTAVPLLHMLQELTKNGDAINVKQVCICFTMDVIGSCAFGIDCNSFQNKNSEFIRMSRKVIHPTKLELLRIFFVRSFPDFSRKFGIHGLANEVDSFFIKTVTDIINYREQNNVQRKDFMQMLIDLKNSQNDEKNDEFIKNFGKAFDTNAVVAQSFLLFLAGFETSSSTLTFTFYELAINQDIQDKARMEIKSILAKHDGKCTYDAINEMKYLTQLLEETLRKYPIVTTIDRRCTRTYKVPDDDLIIEKGTLISISALGIQRNPKYYPDPDKFDPERFSEENKRDRDPYTFLPFGEGPRICIGLRFGIMQAKVALVHLLGNYKFVLNKKTITPLVFDPSPLLSPKGDIWVNAIKLTV